MKLNLFCIILFLSLVQAVYGFDPTFKEYHHPKKSQYKQAFQTILDVEDPCFETITGSWYLPSPKTGNYINYYYLAIDGPGTGTGKARWIAEGLPSGNYLIEFYSDNDIDESVNYPEDARYQVISATGVSDLVVNMHNISDGWHPLGNFDINRVCVINISDYWTGTGTQLRVDALRFTLNTSLPSPPSSTIPPHIGICIDDVGAVDPTQSWQPIYKMLELPFEMTYAVMPLNSYTSQSAEVIYNNSSEVILHQPMGYISTPNPSGSEWIRDNMTLEEVRTVVSTNLDSIPHIAGMNNHTGSLVTQQTDKMQVCMEELASRELFFYDSRTFTMSAAYDAAKNNNILTGERDLFIDGNNKEEAKDLIRELAERALNAPNVPHLAIGHVRTDTADALTEMVSELDAMGVEVWPISKCLSHIVEADYATAGSTFTATGNWLPDSNDKYSKELHHNYSETIIDPASTHSDYAVFTPNIQIAGDYDIYATWVVDSTNSSQIQATVQHMGGRRIIDIDQSESINDWFYLGKYSCSMGTDSYVEFNDYSCTIPGTVFKADAVKYVYSGPLSYDPSAVSAWVSY